jgi:hypothetical protein
LKPGAFRLWVNCTAFFNVHSPAQRAAAESVHLAVLGGGRDVTPPRGDSCHPLAQERPAHEAGKQRGVGGGHRAAELLIPVRRVVALQVEFERQILKAFFSLDRL